jgi:hypothetical protein
MIVAGKGFKENFIQTISTYKIASMSEYGNINSRSSDLHC